MTIARRLQELNIVLPESRPASFSYEKTRRAGNLLYVAGHSPRRDGGYPAVGRLGAEVTLEQGQDCARQCILNALSSIEAAVGSLDGVQSFVKLTGYVASTTDFYDQPLVINAASDLLAEIFGESGHHARSAVGVAVLPGNIPVEIDLVVELKPEAGQAHG
jgi:enamine deaminase RidA (YjgF/YER057c/UK114 family)